MIIKGKSITMHGNMNVKPYGLLESTVILNETTASLGGIIGNFTTLQY